ncbi:MAG TPA: hypothetical protein VM940_01605 [Chthoniobacterales bacterium]|jgi:membrane protease YdiL (CAAX protease family)|nr:hypothetical protein [Chthoniobacterales bacterium]
METSPSRRTTSPGYPWKTFWVLTVACFFAFAAALPYVYSLYRNLVAREPLTIPLPMLVAVQLLQSTFVFGGIVALAILLARKAGIETPILRAWLYSRHDPYPRGWLGIPLLWGLAVGVIISLLYFVVFLPLIPAWPVQAEAALPIWKRFLICFYGAINIEIVMRLFLLSLVIWLFKKVTRSSASSPAAAMFWTANIIVALIYGAAHLSAAKTLMPLTPIVLTAVLLPTGLAALVFGYLTWKRGFEAAMLAHFASDFIAHVVGPMFLR